MVMEDIYYIKQAAINNINLFMRMFVTRPVQCCSARFPVITVHIAMHTANLL